MEKIVEYLKSIGVSTHSLRDNKKANTFISVTSACLLLYVSNRIISTSAEKRRRKLQGIKDIPIPDSQYPWVGHLLSLGELPCRKFSEWHKELGPIINVKMGCQEWISIDSPSLAHKVFAKHGVHTSYRPYTTFSVKYYSHGGKGVVCSQPSNGWNKNRSAVLSVIAPKLVDANYLDSVREESFRFAKRSIEATDLNGITDPFDHLTLMTLNIIFSISFGRKFDSADDPLFRELVHMVEMNIGLGALENDLPNFLPATKIFDYFTGTERKTKEFIDNIRDPLIEQLIKESFDREGPNLVKSLGENGFEMNNDEILVLMADLLSAGTDTVAVTMSWNFAIMCNHPEAQKQVAAEIDAFIKIHGRIPNFNERTELPLCLSVMKECMRYRPTTPFGVAHKTSKDIVVDGYLIPEGYTIIANMETMHKSTEKYSKPDEFMPYRFYDDRRTMQASANGKFENRDQYNFGWGRRICPGMYLAEVEIFFTFIQVFARCYIEPVVEGAPPDIEGAKSAGLTTLPLPYKVKFIKRKDSLIAV